LVRNVIVTGANTGIGLETARQIAKKDSNYRIFLACRDEQKAKVAIENIRATVPSANLEFLPLDLSDLRSVKACAYSFNDRNIPLHILILNAGVQQAGAKTAQGYNLSFGVNHLGHFLFAKLLLPNITQSAPARIVVVSSDTHRLIADGVWDEKKIKALPYIEYTALSSLKGYANSKLLNNWFSHELSRQLKGTGVTVNSLHPGVVHTQLGRNVHWLLAPLVWLSKHLLAVGPEEGAVTSVFVGTDPSIEGITGKYFEKNKEYKKTD